MQGARLKLSQCRRGPALPLGRRIPLQPPTASQRDTSPSVLQIARGRWGNSRLWEGVCGNTAVLLSGCLYPNPFAACCRPRLSNWQQRKRENTAGTWNDHRACRGGWEKQWGILHCSGSCCTS